MLQPNVYGVITSVKQTFTKQCTVVNEDKQFEVFERDDNFILPIMNVFTLKVSFEEVILITFLCTA